MYIVNPAAANGKTGRDWPEIYSLLNRIDGRDLSVAQTNAVGHATELTRNALRDGKQLIIAVGGDGTVNEVINGFFEDGKLIQPEARLGVLSLGTGKDLIKTLKIPADVRDAVQVIGAGKYKKIDIGKAAFVDFSNQPKERYFINVGDIGFSGAVVNRVNQSSKAMGGFITYLRDLFITLCTFKNKTIHLNLHDELREEIRINSVSVANGKFFGGGMQIAPNARIDDGFFDITVIGDVTKFDVIKNVRKLYSGDLIEHPEVRYFKSKKVTIESEEEVLLDLDGELPGKAPVSFEMLPSILNVIVP